jgi:hypothetical protein
MKPLWSRAALPLVFLAVSAAGAADELRENISSEIARNRAVLEALPASAFVDGERPRIKSQLDDAAALLQAERIDAAIEVLSSAAPGVAALKRASTGWDDTGKAGGKGIDALSAEWEAVGRTIRVDRAKFPSQGAPSQNSLFRALAEQAMGQIDEHYAVAVDYGRFSGVTSGAYYLGRAEGHLSFALFLGGLKVPHGREALALGPLTAPIARIESEIVTAYAKPGSTTQHAAFISANSSLKLTKELNQHGLPKGAFFTALRSLFALGLATVQTPPADQADSLQATVEGFSKKFAVSRLDESIGEAFVTKALISLEKSRKGGEGADRERLRVAAIAQLVLPRYIEISKGLQK